MRSNTLLTLTLFNCLALLFCLALVIRMHNGQLSQNRYHIAAARVVDDVHQNTEESKPRLTRMEAKTDTVVTSIGHVIERQDMAESTATRMSRILQNQDRMLAIQAEGRERAINRWQSMSEQLAQLAESIARVEARKPDTVHIHPTVTNPDPLRFLGESPPEAEAEQDEPTIKKAIRKKSNKSVLREARRRTKQHERELRRRKRNTYAPAY